MVTIKHTRVSDVVCAIWVKAFAQEVEIATILFASYLDLPKLDPTFFDHVHD